MEIVDFIIFLIAVSVVAWLGRTWIRAKHGYPVDEDLVARFAELEQSTKVELSAAKAEVGSLKDRVQVLERITTDEGIRLADEIERLKALPEPEESLADLTSTERVANK